MCFFCLRNVFLILIFINFFFFLHHRTPRGRRRNGGCSNHFDSLFLVFFYLGFLMVLFRSKYLFLLSNYVDAGERRRCLAISILQLIWEPIQTFIEAVAACSTCRLNVPASVSTKGKVRRLVRSLDIARKVRIAGSFKKVANSTVD